MPLGLYETWPSEADWDDDLFLRGFGSPLWLDGERERELQRSLGREEEEC